MAIDDFFQSISNEPFDFPPARPLRILFTRKLKLIAIFQINVHVLKVRDCIFYHDVEKLDQSPLLRLPYLLRLLV